jgi:hypothetical protein
VGPLVFLFTSPRRDKGEMLSEIRRQIKNRVDLIKLSGDSQAQEKDMDAGPCFNDDEMHDQPGTSTWTQGNGQFLLPATPSAGG